MRDDVKNDVVEITAMGIQNSMDPLMGWDHATQAMRKFARSAIRALESAGYRIVGREATEAMENAAADTALDDYHQFDDIDFGKVLAAAFDAAPLYGEVGE